MFIIYRIICLWVLRPIKKFLIIMPMRRDLPIFSFLLILFIILFYQLNYTYEPSLPTESLVLSNSEKFQIRKNTYSSV